MKLTPVCPPNSDEVEACLPSKYLFNLHLGENHDEDWMKKLVVEVRREYEDDRQQWDAAEFLEGLLPKLKLPEELFKSLRQVQLTCTGQKCSKSPLNAAYDDDRLGISVFTLTLRALGRNHFASTSLSDHCNSFSFIKMLDLLSLCQF